jgi:hypothetical protein
VRRRSRLARNLFSCSGNLSVANYRNRRLEAKCRSADLQVSTAQAGLELDATPPTRGSKVAVGQGAGLLHQRTSTSVILLREEEKSRLNALDMAADKIWREGTVTNL